jgi:hypothetical protein
MHIKPLGKSRRSEDIIKVEVDGTGSGSCPMKL